MSHETFIIKFEQIWGNVAFMFVVAGGGSVLAA